MVYQTPLKVELEETWNFKYIGAAVDDSCPVEKSSGLGLHQKILLGPKISLVQVNEKDSTKQLKTWSFSNTKWHHSNKEIIWIAFGNMTILLKFPTCITLFLIFLEFSTNN